VPIGIEIVRSVSRYRVHHLGNRRTDGHYAAACLSVLAEA